MGKTKEISGAKLRGGYYTPPSVAQWMCKWAIRTGGDRVVEPSCGDGSFIEAAAKRLLEFSVSPNHVPAQLTGIEVDSEEAEKTRMRLSGILGVPAEGSIANDDFFSWVLQADQEADCVVGNPPFIRYQSFPEPCRSFAMSLMSRHGLRPNKLTNIWVPFVVGATMLLRPGGRLALVLPAELLQVSYASQLRCFLVDSFKRIDVVACNELFFVDAEQEVVLLLADGKLAERSPTNRCQIDLKVKKCVSEVLSSSLFPPARIARPKLVQHDSEKWLKYFLTAGEISFMRELRQSPEIGTLADHAGIDVGIVTGDNDFFVLKMSQARSLGVDKYTIPLVGRSSQLPGAVLDASDWGSLVAHDKAVLLFYLNGHAYDGLSVSAKHYISHGEAHKVHEGYKCSIRSPWYKVPAVWEPHCFLFRQIYDFPRMVLNSAKAVSTDTIHRATCKASPAKTAANVYTHLTAASAEIEGRSYGGGVLELEPTEAERILMPRSLQPGLPIHEIDRLVKAGKIAHVLAENDRNILMKGIGLSERDCVKLKDIWAKMRTRRHSRRKN